MSACIFIGPTIPVHDAIALNSHARYLPPVQHGAIYTAVKQWSPTIIGIVDGYFQHCPSVWHKEILWALDQGVHVLGAASMGALRAAELEPFGMIGIGKVYEAYLAGALPPFDGICDDDEVAVTHAPAESGYISISEAMINIRHTLDSAHAAEIIDTQTLTVLVEEAKSMHFSKRTYTHVIERACNQGACSKTLKHLSTWLPTGKIDQKLQDAVDLIEHIASIDHEGLPPHSPNFKFETTEIFHDALLTTPIDPCSNNEKAAYNRAVVDELRLDEATYHHAKREALAKHFITNWQHFSVDNNSKPLKVSDNHLRRLTDEFRRANTLLDRESVDLWLDNNDLDVADFDDLIRAEAQFDVNITLPDAPSIAAILINFLIINGQYPALALRARHKSRILAQTANRDLPASHLLHWYFEKRRGESVPLDVTAHAQRLGLNSEADLITLLSREYGYLAQLPVDIAVQDGEG